MKNVASLNGKIQPLDECRVSPMDRGYLFGDGVYEVIHLYNGRPYLLHRHMARLSRSLDELRIGPCDLQALEGRIGALVEASTVRDGLIYLQITRGVYPVRSHAYDPSPEERIGAPTEFLFVSAAKDLPGEAYAQGCKAVTFDDLRWQRCDIKSLNLLGNVMAAQYAKERGATEAILIGRDGKVMEGSHTSVFWIREGVLQTNPLTDNVLPSITRSEVISLAAKIGVPFEESYLTRPELYLCDEVFITGTMTQVMGVSEIDGKKIGSGAQGPLTEKLHEAFDQELEAFAGDD